MPAEVLKRFRVHEANDDRLTGAARLLQALRLGSGLVDRPLLVDANADVDLLGTGIRMVHAEERVGRLPYQTAGQRIVLVRAPPDHPAPRIPRSEQGGRG